MRETHGDDRTTTPAPPTYPEGISTSREERSHAHDEDRSTARPPSRSRHRLRQRRDVGELHEVIAPRNGRDPRSE